MSIWILNMALHGFPDEIVVGNDRLYTFADRGMMRTDMAYWTNIPLTPEALPPQPKVKIYDNSTIFYDWYGISKALLYVKDGNVTLINVQRPIMGRFIMRSGLRALAYNLNVLIGGVIKTTDRSSMKLGQ
ncbi:hypothetical protein BG015_004482 [Linnemannia schmuckeri]|uniref:Uncharacterized protein n=1 Tax=Linnemannia schmuckeri TaxID=64567 RepID=A0A9P5RBJ0_9FUNG|nr:hypothetical protein BG015_004482 [Linnemannia schmuckeri]